jgi:hypothetical protein
MDNMALYNLPSVPPQEQLRQAIHTSLKLRYLSKQPSIGFVFLATTYLPLLGEAYRITISLWYKGISGSRKSATAGVQLSHYGPGFSDGKTFPANWEDTDNDVEYKCHYAKDVLFPIDDFAPKGSKYEVDKSHNKVDRVIRGVANKSGKGRLNVTSGGLGERKTYSARGLPLGTGEDTPRGHSLQTRMLVVPFSSGTIDLHLLTELQAAGHRGELAESMAGFIQWLAPQIPTLKKTIGPQVESWRGKVPGHGRNADTLGFLMTGLSTFLDYATATGALSEEERQRELQAGREALTTLLLAQDALQQESDIANRFLELLVAALASGRCHLRPCNLDGSEKEHTSIDRALALPYGWMFDGFSIKPQGAMLGWVTDKKVYLIGEASFASMQSFASEQGVSIGESPRTVWERLDEKGYLQGKDKEQGRMTSKVTIAGRQQRLYVLLHSALWPEETSEPEVEVIHSPAEAVQPDEVEPQREGESVWEKLKRMGAGKEVNDGGEV